VPHKHRKHYVEDTTPIRIADLRLHQCSSGDGVIPGDQPIRYAWRIGTIDGRVTLGAGRHRCTFDLTSTSGGFARNWYFKDRGRMYRFVHFLENEGFGTRHSLRLENECRGMGKRKRLRRQRERLVREQMDLENLKPVTRLREIENRLGWIRKELV
jgi:hypothetical protein